MLGRRPVLRPQSTTSSSALVSACSAQALTAPRAAGSAAARHIVASNRDEAVRRGAGTLTVERYAVPVFEREGPVRADAGVRLTRMDVEPSGVDDAVEVFGDITVPWLADTDGFRCMLYLVMLCVVDYHSGHTISESIWRDTEDMAASRSAAAAARVEAVPSAGCVVRAVEEYSVALSSARKY